MSDGVRKMRTALATEVHLPAFWINLAVKAVLVCLLVFGAFSGLQQFEGKAFLWRLVTYPVAAFVVPITWFAVSGRAR